MKNDLHFYVLPKWKLLRSLADSKPPSYINIGEQNCR